MHELVFAHQKRPVYHLLDFLLPYLTEKITVSKQLKLRRCHLAQTKLHIKKKHVDPRRFEDWRAF